MVPVDEQYLAVRTMLGGLLSVRLKAAEQALRDKRLDDVYRTLAEPDIRNNRRGTRLAADLAKAFFQRARDHYRAERFTEALLDLNKADTCGGVDAQVARLREQVLTVANEVARTEAQRRARVEDARQRMIRGSLAAGRRILKEADTDDKDAKKLTEEIACRQRRAGELLDQAEAAIKKNQLNIAVERLVEARKLDAHNDRVVRCETTLCDRVVSAARDAVKAGRLGRAQMELDKLGPMGRDHAARTELLDALRLARSAGEALASGRFEEAQRLAHRLQRACPKTPWVAEAVRRLDTIDDAILALRSGPLAEAASGNEIEDRKRPKGQRVGLEETVALGRPVPVSPSLPRKLLLLVDGGGSYLLDRDGRVSIGRATSSDPADIPIWSDLSERHAEIARVEDDYFLLSPHEVEVSGRRTRHRLLRDGDRVVLARRARFTFRLPNRKSASARLDLSDSTRMPNDVRKIIVFRQTAMIGRGPGCHIVCHSAGRDLVLFERGERLWVRPQGRTTDTRDALPLELGKPIEIDGLSLVIEPWSVRVPGSGPMA